jgi:hypothetical protein
MFATITDIPSYLHYCSAAAVQDGAYATASSAAAWIALHTRLWLFQCATWQARQQYLKGSNSRSTSTPSLDYKS